MYDFVNTGRPMVFFTHDLEAYRDDLRGFYVDFEAEAPGRCSRTRRRSSTPSVTSTASRPSTPVATRRSGEVRLLEDGRAAARFVDQFLTDGA